MDDKSLPHGRIPVPTDPQIADAAVADRRAFFRRAVAIGVPVVLATVQGRSALAQSPEPSRSGCASLGPSGWRVRTYGDQDSRCNVYDNQLK
jgi:hypothetical protein